MKTRWLASILVPAFIMLASNVNAQATAEQKDNALYRISVSEFDMASKTERSKVAKLINRDCKSSNAKIPSLSPSEKKWLNDEMSANRNGVWDSYEMVKFIKKQHLENCIAAATPLTHNDINWKTEVTHWAMLAHSLSFSDGEYMHDKLMDKEGIKFTGSEGRVLKSGALYSTQILGGIIIPMLHKGE